MTCCDLDTDAINNLKINNFNLIIIGYKFIGCLVDNRARMLDVKHVDRKMTLQKCAKLCSEYSFFGVQVSVD